MQNSVHADPEDPSLQKRSDSSKREFTEAAFLLALWSILAANEGVIRFIQKGTPSNASLFTSSNPNIFVGPFLGGLFEVIFGLFGLCVGLSAGLLGFFSRKLTMSLLITQVLLGWYVFIDYIFVLPAFRISKIVQPSIPGLTVEASKLIGVFGILTSIGFCLSLQGGQFVFIARLLAYSSDRDFLKQRTGNRMRAIFWNMNQALAGLWAIVQACIVLNQIGAGLTPNPFFAPPNVGRIPVYLLITGIIMFMWPLLGAFIAASGRTQMVRQYCVLSFFVFLAVYVHYTIGQLGFLAAGEPGSATPAAGASTHNGLVMMMSTLGPYFMLKQAQEDDM